MWRTRKKTRRLSTAQWEAVDAAIDDFIRVPAEADPADRPVCERAALELYELAGLPPPDIHWYLDPVSMLREAALDVDAGLLVHKQLERYSSFLLHDPDDEPVVKLLKRRVRERFRPLRFAALGQHVAIMSAVPADGPGVRTFHPGQLPGLVSQIHAAIQSQAPKDVPQSWGSPLGALMPATTMPQNLMMFGALYEIGECGNFKTYRQRFTLARHCGPVIAQRNVCRLCERPSEIHHDERSWLHAEGRAALCYRSGLSFYRWHGIDMPAGLVLKDPGSITLDDIIEQPTMMHRRVLIERMGVDRFVRRHAMRVSADECGCLWAASFRTSRPEWAAVEVVNSSSSVGRNIDGMRVIRLSNRSAAVRGIP